MTIDPALTTQEAPSRAIAISQLNITPNDVYLFDFDGVISSRFEDDIYRLPAISNERTLIAAAARYFEIKCSEMEQKYQRHLVYQAAAWKSKIEIQPGPGYSFATKAGLYAHLFITTARSGWYAVERLREFLKQKSIVPIEVYNVGRVSKDRQIKLLTREFPQRTVYFIEDSPAHLIAAEKLHLSKVSLVSVPSMPPVDETTLRRHFYDTIERALSL